MPRQIPIAIGDRFHRFTVIARLEKGQGQRLLCQCDCGEERVHQAYTLKKAIVKSCGCYSREAGHTRTRRHGHTAEDATGTPIQTPEYKAWLHMRDRCELPTCKQFKHYGARGIRVYPGWAASFEAFLRDVGPRPSRRHSLDRRDNEGHYEPDNVRWATGIEQANNTRRNHRLTLRGETLTVAEWSRRLGINVHKLYQRVNRLGWSDERALTT